MEEDARLAKFKAENPDFVPPPPVIVEAEIPEIKPPVLPSAVVKKSVPDFSSHTHSADGKQLHPHVSLTRDHEPVLHTSYLGDLDANGTSPILMTIEQQKDKGKVKIHISKRYPKVSIPVA